MTEFPEETYEDTRDDLEFHLHNDTELLTAYPKHWVYGAEIYAMQEGRVVFIGSIKSCEQFIERNKGKEMPDIKVN